MHVEAPTVDWGALLAEAEAAHAEAERAWQRAAAAERQARAQRDAVRREYARRLHARGDVEAVRRRLAEAEAVWARRYRGEQEALRQAVGAGRRRDALAGAAAEARADQARLELARATGDVGQRREHALRIIRHWLGANLLGGEEARLARRLAAAGDADSVERLVRLVEQALPAVDAERLKRAEYTWQQL